jgi:hypothetical protein
MTSISHAIGWRRYVRPGVLVLVTGISLYLLLPSLVAVFASSRSLRHLTWYWAGPGTRE